MFWLSLGAGLWFFGHGFKALFPEYRKQLEIRLGTDKAKGLFAFTILASFISIIWGWRHADPNLYLYHPSRSLYVISFITLIPALYLILSSTTGVRLRQWIRHPQLIGFFLFSIAHLLCNGEVRSVILFGTFSLWSLVLIPRINKRDGTYVPPKIVHWPIELKFISITTIAYIIILATHGLYTSKALILW